MKADAIVPKFELLKATAIGRLQGYDAFNEAINFVALNYANTPEGAQAQNMVNNLLPKLKNTTFVPEEESKNFKVVFTFENGTDSEINNFHKTLNEVSSKVEYYDLKTSIDLYNPTKTFVIVHGLKSINGAKGFSELLKIEDKHKISKPSFAISSENYQIIQVHKNLESYLKDN